MAFIFCSKNSFIISVFPDPSFKIICHAGIKNSPGKIGKNVNGIKTDSGHYTKYEKKIPGQARNDELRKANHFFMLNKKWKDQYVSAVMPGLTRHPSLIEYL